MSTNFPTALDTFTNPTPTDHLNSPSHAGQHANANDAIEAIETYIGVGGGETSLLIKMLKAVYPVGSAYFNYSNATNPATLLGFGTWVAAAVGRTIVGIDAAQTEFDSAGETGGAKTHKLTAAESGNPAHNHGNTGNNNANHTHGLADLKTNNVEAGGGIQLVHLGSFDNRLIVKSAAGAIMQSYGASNAHQHATNNNTATNASQAHNNLQPYEVWYIWRRTA